MKWTLIKTRMFRFTLNEISFDFGKHQFISDVIARFGGGQLTFKYNYIFIINIVVIVKITQ